MAVKELFKEACLNDKLIFEITKTGFSITYDAVDHSATITRDVTLNDYVQHGGNFASFIFRNVQELQESVNADNPRTGKPEGQ